MTVERSKRRFLIPLVFITKCFKKPLLLRISHQAIHNICMGRLLREKRQQSELAEQDGEEALLEKEREKQLKFEKEKLEMKLKYEEKSAELRNGKQGEPSGSNAELPKLSITKYDGKYEQWLPFWNKFCVETESTNLAPVTKFAYFKELLQPQVRADIDGLPFSTFSQSMGKPRKLLMCT